MTTSERLQKVLAQAGLGSRREMEQCIEAGSVRVNGKVATIGMSVGPNDSLSFKGRSVPNPLKHAKPKTRVLIYHKPVGEISSRRDPLHKSSVFDNLPRLNEGRWIQIGRLDLNTSGLMLFTNDGELANRYMHPSQEIEREYAVRVNGRVSDEMIRNLLKGVQLEDGMAAFKRIDFQGGEGANGWYHVVLCEGRNREVRRLWASQGLQVSRLIRIRFGSAHLPRDLPRGKAREMTEDELSKFLQ